MPADPPYLSVVATARNDDHGANLLRRLQTFVNALTGQAARHGVPMELLLVEWNPPAEKPPLAQALCWPAEPGPCAVRIVTVPPELHRRYRHGESLPLYQMIAKNAGIRRAAGEFILATNIDILLSDELMRFLAERQLQPDRMYRIDRHDVDADVPVEARDEERLEYCRTHRLRLNAREGTFTLTPEGYRATSAADITSPGSGIFFGTGWHVPQQYFGQVFRLAAERAEVVVRPSPQPRTLFLETAGDCELLLEGAGVRIQGRSLVRIPVPANAPGLTVAASGRFRALRCGWDHAPVNRILVSKAPARRAARVARILAGAGRWMNVSASIPLPLPSRVLERIQFRPGVGGLSVSLSAARGMPPADPPANLHTNACGDFTMLHRDRWKELRGYPEFDLYSMNIDSVLCYMAHYGGAVEEVLPEPMRIYHIEHAAGSGWSPEGQHLLFERLAAKGIPWLEWDQVLDWATSMQRFRTTMVFNRRDWGLAADLLPEVQVGPV